MRLLVGDDRARALRGFLPDGPEPGCQAVEHFLRHAPTVGDLWVTDDAASGVVVAAREAFVMGEPDPEIGRLLHRNGYYGTVCPGVSSLDTTGFVDVGVRAAVTRAVFTKEHAFERPPLPAPLEVADVDPTLDHGVTSSRGRWVLSLWAAPHEAVGAQVILDGSRVVAVGGARTLSDDHAEIAAWIDRPLAGRGLLANASAGLFARYGELGIAITSVISTENEPALRYARKVGWEQVGEETLLQVGDPRHARPGSSPPWRG